MVEFKKERECSVKDIAEYYIEEEPQIAHTAVNSDERSANGSDTIRNLQMDTMKRYVRFTRSGSV